VNLNYISTYNHNCIRVYTSHLSLEQMVLRGEKVLAVNLGISNLISKDLKIKKNSEHSLF